MDSGAEEIAQVWLAVEKTDPCAIGDIIDPVNVVTALGARGIARLSFSKVCVQCFDELGHKDIFRESLRRLASD